MVEYNKVNLKLSNSQLIKFKNAVKELNKKSNNGTTLKIDNKNFNKADLIHELFLITTQINKLKEKIENNMSADIKLSKAQINRIIKSGGASGSILGRFLPKLIKPAILLGKNILAPLGLSAAMSATDAAIQRKMYGGATKTAKFSNEDIKDLTKIVKALEDSNVLMKGVTETLKSDIRKGGALPLIPMLLGTLGVSLLSRKGLYRAGTNKRNCGQGLFRARHGKGMYRAGKGLFRAGQGIKKKSLMPPHPLTNYEIIEYFKDEPRFNGVFSKDNFPKTIKKELI